MWTEAQKADWNRRIAVAKLRISETLEGHKLDFLAFREIASSIFKTKADGKVYTRKPPIALRLRDAETPSLVAATPSWSRYGRKLNCEEVRVEVLREQKVTTKDGKEKFLLDCPLAVVFAPAWPPRLCRYGLDPDCDSTLASIVQAFLADPLQVTRRSTNNCCICGRGLTDGASKSRGIGPECLKSIPMLLFKQSLIDFTCEQADWALDSVNA
jgi:hypothetical protein